MGICISIGNGITIGKSETTPVKRQKGTSLLACPNDYTIIDLETTGYNPHYDEIIEVACVKYRDGKEIAQFKSLVQPYWDPEDGCYIDDFIEGLTGINNEMLRGAPQFHQIANDVWNFLSGETLVGHNVNFDINFLYDYFVNDLKMQLQNNFVDTLRLSRRVLPDLENHTLDTLSDYFKIFMPHHRALNDCLITHGVFEGMKSIIEKDNISLSPYYSKALDLKTLVCDNSHINPDHMFYKKHCVFTGKLERFSRKDAAQIVVNIGGICDNGITHKTNFLIVGNLDFISSIKNGKTTKMKKAEHLILDAHQDLKILNEDTFCDLISDI